MGARQAAGLHAYGPDLIHLPAVDADLVLEDHAARGCLGDLIHRRGDFFRAVGIGLRERLGRPVADIVEGRVAVLLHGNLHGGDDVVGEV